MKDPHVLEEEAPTQQPLDVVDVPEGGNTGGLVTRGED